MDTLTRNLIATLALVSASLLLLPGTALGQNAPGEFYVGFQGGISQAKLNVDQGSASYESGVTGGLQFIYNLNEALSVQLDVMYAERGASDVTATGGPDVSDAFDLSNDKVSLNYYDFPLLLKLTAPIESVKLRALAGPSVSLISSASMNGRSAMRNLQSELQVKDRFLAYDLGGVVGGEIALPLEVPSVGDVEVAIDGRYNFGLINVDSTQDFDMNNRSITGSLMIRFPLQ